MKRNKKKNDKGFSLIEILVAVMILAIAVAPILHAFLSSTRTNAKAKRLLRATTAAQNIMEEIKAADMAELMALSGDAVVSQISEKKIEITYNNVEVSDERYKVVAVLDAEEYTAATGEALNYNDMEQPVIESMNSATDGGYMPVSGIAQKTAREFSDHDAYEKMTKTTTLNIDTSSGKSAVIDVVYDLVSYQNGVEKTESRREVPANTYLFRSGSAEDKLHNIYIFFEPLYTAVGKVPKEKIIVNNNGPDAVTVYLVKQKVASATAADEMNYAVEVQVHEPNRGKDWSDDSEYTPMTRIRTNLPDEQMKLGYYSSVPTVMSAEKMVGLKGMAGGTVEDKLYKVEVSVYDEKGKELAKVDGTKEKR